MAGDEKWYFTKEQLLQSPSRKSGYDVDKELSCRQQAANFIQDMGQRLQVSQLCINTAIVYMHRFYVFHSLAAFHRNAIAAAALFLAAKVEEQPRKLEHVIKVAHMCLHRENPNLDTKSELYLEQAQDLVFNENVLLQTLGFDVAIDHPHTHVVRCCQLVRASKDLAQTSYFMASNSLHLTTMCLQYKPTVVACFCIHLACKWSNWEIPRSNEGKDWFWYIDKTVTIDLLEQLTAEFLAILDKCPTKLKRKMMSMNQNNTPGFTQSSIPHDGLQFEEPKKVTGSDAMKPPEGLFPIQKSSSQSGDKPGSSSSSSSATAQAPHSHHQKIDYKEYREKKERERMEREKQQQHQQQHQRDSHNVSSSNHHHHHHKSSVMSGKSHSNVQSRNSSGSVSHKSYQQPPHGMQQNMHFQNVKESRDSSSQGFQSSSSVKDSNYLKQHPPHTERDGSKDNLTFHGQYSQNSNVQHQGYPHKSESGYSGSYSHRESSKGNHSVQSSGNSNLPQSHHNQNSNSINVMGSQRDSLVNQRDIIMNRDSDSQSQNHAKDSMSSSIRDIISQTVSQKDVHSMTNERKEHIRDKSRMNYIHGSSSSANFRPESIKPGREQAGLNFHESDRKIKKVNEESVIDSVKSETIPIKIEKFDETDLGDESSWNWKNDKNLGSIKSEPSAVKNEISVDSNFSDSVKAQNTHSSKVYDPKYKSHHYHSSGKNSDMPPIKTEKPGPQNPNEMHKKLNDRSHDKHRKPQELERSLHGIEGNNFGDASKHHKPSKEGSDKHKMLLPGQHSEQRMKEKLSPSKYQKTKTVPRPPNLGFVKAEPSLFNLETNTSSNATEETGNHSLSLKPIVIDEGNKSIGSLSSFQKQKNHEFGAPGNLSSSLPDANFVKSSKTSSIFSPDSKISPQNILSSLDKDSKKSSFHRSHASSKSSPEPSKKHGPSASLGAITTPTTSSTGSLFSPPLPKNIPSIPSRHRTSSSGSEPELIPVLTKLEETPGYENIIRERKMTLTPTDSSPASEKEKRFFQNEKLESSNAFVLEFDNKTNTKDEKTNDLAPNLVKSEVLTQTVSSKSVTNVKFPSEIRSDLGAVIYPTNPKSTSTSKSNQNFSLNEPKLSLANSVSTVNLLGIEKMVDTSISPAKQINQFSSGSVKLNTSNSNLNVSTPVNTFGSVNLNSAVDAPVNDQKISNIITNQESMDVDVLGYSEKKRSEKKKKKEKHKHKEKDKDKSERKKEKKKHKDKDKERSKEKDKHKDKEKSKEKDKHKEKEIDVVSSETPIKITIPKDKISAGLKIKIPKDCLKKDEPEPPKTNTTGELKIKISKDVFSNIGSYKEESRSESKKRERSPKSSSELPHPKSLKTSEKKSSSSSVKSNGTEGSSRNSSSHKHSVSENGSYLDISSLYDFPFDFEENGQGIIKTPDYDFEALDALELPTENNTSPNNKEIEECDKNSHNESEVVKDDDIIATNEFDSCAISPKPSDIDVSCSGLPTDPVPEPLSPIDKKDSPKLMEETTLNASNKASLILESHTDIKKSEILDESKNEDKKRKDKMISVENCDVLKNYKTILDSHSRRTETEILKYSVSPVSPEETGTESNTNNDTNNNNNNSKNNTNESSSYSEKISYKGTKNDLDSENPNYYNKYFKKDSSSRLRSRDDKKIGKGRLDEKGRFDDRQRYYDSRRYRTDYNDRDRRDERWYYRDYRDYSKDSQYYYDRKDDRRFEYPDYSSNQYFNSNKTESNVAGLTYEMTQNSNGNPSAYQSCSQNKNVAQFQQICDPTMAAATPDINMQYQYGYYNNYMFANGGYRFYGNVPYVNMSLMQQQPMPPGTGETIPVRAETPPLPLEPPPDLPPPPKTPPPPPK